MRVRAAGLNGADMLQRKGAYPAPPGSPADIPGLELAGEVAGLGPGAARFAEGDRVMAIVGGGGQAELAVVHERQLMPVPDALDWPQAGGVPEVFTTAHDAIFTQARPAGGRAPARPRRRRRRGHRRGAARPRRGRARHRHRPQRGAARRRRRARRPRGPRPRGVRRRTGPFDVVLELVGAPNLPGDLAALATGGRIVVIGVGAGFKAEVNLLALMGKRATLRASTLRARPLEEKAATARALERHVLPLLERGELRVPVAATFALDDVGAAYERFAAGGKLGKIVLLTG